MDSADAAFATADEQYEDMLANDMSPLLSHGVNAFSYLSARKWKAMEYECIGWEFHSCMCDCQNCL